MSFTPVPESSLNFGPFGSAYSLSQAAELSSNAAAPVSAENSFWGEEGFSFKNILDVVNPLQQLPVVSTVYRAVSGDTISTGARLAGGALLGGPLGFFSALLNEIVQQESGRDIGGNVLALLGGDDAAAASVAGSGFKPVDTADAYQRKGYQAYSQAVLLS